MQKVKIKDKEYNVSNVVKYHIEGLETENRVFSLEIKGHEAYEAKLEKIIKEALDFIEDATIVPQSIYHYRNTLYKILKGEK